MHWLTFLLQSQEESRIQPEGKCPKQIHEHITFGLCAFSIEKTIETLIDQFGMQVNTIITILGKR